MLKPPAQCCDCRHLQRRGGVILEAREECVVLEDSPSAAVLGRVLQVLAEDGRCPEHNVYESHPDAYRSVDLGTHHEV
jgi:hypothetical protein